MTVHRRKVLKGLLASGVGAAALKAPMVLAQAAPFKIGLLTIKTGPLAQGGIQMEQGLLTFLKEKNNSLGGRKIELISADTGGNPSTIRVLKQSGLSIVLVEQNPKLVFDIADDIVILNSGRVAIVSAAETLQRDAVDLRQHLGVF